MRSNSKGFIQIIIILVVLALVGGAYYFGTLKTKQNVVSEVPTVSPMVSTDPSSNPITDPKSGWKTYSYKSCGTDQPKVDFSISLPPNFDIVLATEKMWASYDFKNGNSHIKVACGEGFGGGCDEKDQTTFKVNGIESWGCYVNKIGGGFYIKHRDVFFSFLTNLDRKTFDQILSTFQFTN